MSCCRVAGVSYPLTLWDVKGNYSKLEKYVREVSAEGAELVASPEGALDGYLTKEAVTLMISKGDAESKGYEERLKAFRIRQIETAADIRDTYVPRLRQLARELGVWFLPNILDLRDGDDVFNTTFIINPDGEIIAKYDKIHAGFEPGNLSGKSHAVFDTSFGTIGVLICADRQYPEAGRAVALLGASLVVVNSYGMHGEGANERFIRQRAYENGFYLLFVHPAEIVLVDPEGKIIGGTSSWEHKLVREVDLQAARGRGVWAPVDAVEAYVTDPEKYGRKYNQLQERIRQEGN